MVISGGRLTDVGDVSVAPTWAFPEPFGAQRVAPVAFSEVIAIADHLHVGELRSYLTTAPLDDLRDPRTPPPTAADATGRSSQRFMVDVTVRRDGQTTRLAAAGRDIYAVTAPILVEGAVRLLDGRTRRLGAGAPGAVFDAASVLSALSGHALELSGATLQPA